MTKPTSASLTRRHLLTTGASLPVVLGASSCGYLLYPGRRGTTSGPIDLLVLIVDLLWFLPGIIPGAICLIVDFTTGCIYGGSRAEREPTGGSQDNQAIALVELDGLIVGPDGQLMLNSTSPVDAEAVKQRGRLVIQHRTGARAEAFFRDFA